MSAVKQSLLALFLAVYTTGLAYAIEVKPYSDPLPIGNYVEDVDALVERAFLYDGWVLRSKPDDHTYIGFISYKGYDITVRIKVNDGQLLLSLDSAHESGCGDACEDLGEKRVVGWLVVLRRAIALELTRAVGEQLAELAIQKS